MSWIYCQCGHGFDEPTDEEVLDAVGCGLICPDCGLANDPRKYLEDVVRSLLLRVDKLEKRKKKGKK